MNVYFSQYPPALCFRYLVRHAFILANGIFRDVARLVRILGCHGYLEGDLGREGGGKSGASYITVCHSAAPIEMHALGLVT